MIRTPIFQFDKGQLIARVGVEAFSLGLYPPANAEAAIKMLNRAFLLGVRAKRHEIADVLTGMSDPEPGAILSPEIK